MESNTCPDSDLTCSHESITAQLDRILSSDTFNDVPGLRQFLGYVVNETLSGRTDPVQDFTLANDVCKREDLIDAQNPTIVRVETDHLRRRLTDYYFTEGQRDPIRIQLPKGTCVPVFEELPPTVEEVATEGPAFEPPRTRGSRPTRNGILAFVAILLALFAFFRVYVLLKNENSPAGNNTLSTRPAIAVLPDTDLGREMK